MAPRKPFNSTNSREKLGAAVAFASSGKGVGVEGVENVADKDFVVSGFQPEAGGRSLFNSHKFDGDFRSRV